MSKPYYKMNTKRISDYSPAFLHLFKIDFETNVYKFLLKNNGLDNKAMLASKRSLIKICFRLFNCLS